MMKLSNTDLSLLANYRFISDDLAKSHRNRQKNSTLLCIRNKELALVDRKDVTKWELFKSYFGCGKLADCNLRLAAIGKYLEERDISEVAKDHPAYKTIHDIAARMLVYKKAGSNVPHLWQKLATETKKLSIEFYKVWHPLQGNPSEDLVSLRNRVFFITPHTKVGHLAAQAELEKRKCTWEKPAIAACEGKKLIDSSTPVDATVLNRLKFRAKVYESYEAPPPSPVYDYEEPYGGYRYYDPFRVPAPRFGYVW
jgi:hypothetical protein